MSAERDRVLVVGGGIAGLAVAWRLAVGMGRGVRLVEAERLFGAHASSHNAAMWLPHEADETTPRLARLSETLLDGLLGRGGWRVPRTAWLSAAEPEVLLAPREAAWQAGLKTSAIMEGRDTPPHPLLEALPVVGGGRVRAAVRVEGGGVIDVHGVLTALTEAARRAGARLERGRRAVAWERAAGSVAAVQMDDGTRVLCDAVVIAAGAWAAGFEPRDGASERLRPLRRHLIQLGVAGAERWPMLWHLGTGECYFRPESGGVLASGCDETPWWPATPAVDDAVVAAAAERLLRVAPGLATAARRRAWACLRTFASDRELWLGEDPDVPGLWWCAGLGGRGMTVGVGAAEWLARAMLKGERLPPAVCPGRGTTSGA